MTLNELGNIIDDEQYICIYIEGGNVSGLKDTLFELLKDDVLEKTVDVIYATEGKGKVVLKIWTKLSK